MSLHACTQLRFHNEYIYIYMYIYIYIFKQYHGHVGCQLAVAEAHVPAYVSLLPKLRRSSLCLTTHKTRAKFRTQKRDRNSETRSLASKFVAPILGPWSGSLYFRKAPVELRELTSFINGFFALGCEDAGFTVNRHVHIFVYIYIYTYISYVYSALCST